MDKSNFNMTDFAIIELNYSAKNSKLNFEDAVSNIEAQASVKENDGKLYGKLKIHVVLSFEDGSEFNCTSESLFFMEHSKNDSENDKNDFMELIKLNGAIHSLSLLRDQLHMITLLIGAKGAYILPFINLNDSEWKK